MASFRIPWRWSRLTSTGSLDTSFGIGGESEVTDAGTQMDRPTAIAIDANGDIVVGGLAAETSTWSWLVVRYCGG